MTFTLREREEKGTTNSAPKLMNDGGHSLNGTLSMPDFGTLQFWYHMGNHSYTITGQFFSGHNFVQKKNIQEESIYYLWGEFGGNLNFQKYSISGH